MYCGPATALQNLSVFSEACNLNNDVYLVSNYGGEVTGLGYEYNLSAGFKNFWTGRIGGGLNFSDISTTMLRGGPSMMLPNSQRMYISIGSDNRKIISGSLSGFGRWGAEDYFNQNSLSLSLTAKPVNTLSVSINPSYSWKYHELQYVTTRAVEEEERYIFGAIDQKVLSMSVRINFNITPDLTIQYWGQPFIASGGYSGFKMITDPQAENFSNRYHEYTDGQMSYSDDRYQIDEAMDGVNDYSFSDPNFTVDEWLSNLVIRWEFLPGSTAYLVWSQTRDHYDPSGMFEVWDNMDQMFTAKRANNTILLKVSYRIGLR